MKVLSKQISDKDFWKGFYTLTLFLGLILMYLEIFLYRKTLIDVKILLIIISVIGLISFIFNRKHYKLTYDLKRNFFPLMQNILSWGFISCYVFMAVNYYFADKQKDVYAFKIKSKSSIQGSRASSQRQPTICFDYQHFEKELVFLTSDFQLVDRSDSIKVQIQKGAFGFDIISDYELIEEKINNR